MVTHLFLAFRRLIKKDGETGLQAAVSKLTGEEREILKRRL